MELWKNLLETKPERNAENPSWLWSLLACHLGTVRTVRLFSLANHSWCPRPPPSLSCPSVGSCSLLACHFDRSPAIEALLAGRARPDPPLPLPTLSAHLLATFGLLFTLAWATCLEMIASDDKDDDYPNPRVAFRVSESVSVPCCRSCFVSVRFYRLCSCGFLDGFVRWDGKRKAQFLEALFRAFLVEASRLKVKGRPAR